MRKKQTFAQLKKSLNAEQLNELLAVETFPDLKVFLDTRINSCFATPLEDKDIPEQFQHLVSKYRILATRLGWNGVIAYSVRAGFHFKNAPNLGPCDEDWKHLLDSKMQECDEMTLLAIVFWIPRILDESTDKNMQEQKQLLAELRAELVLPNHHLVNFGSASLLTALILSHYKHTNEDVPLDNLIARTDTVDTDGDRFCCGFEEGMFCDFWNPDNYKASVIGCFALGVEALES